MEVKPIAAAVVGQFEMEKEASQTRDLMRRKEPFGRLRFLRAGCGASRGSARDAVCYYYPSTNCNATTCQTTAPTGSTLAEIMYTTKNRFAGTGRCSTHQRPLRMSLCRARRPITKCTSTMMTSVSKIEFRGRGGL